MLKTLAAAAALMASAFAAHADCFVQGQVFIQHSGPFTMQMAANSGRICNANFLTVAPESEGQVSPKNNWMLKNLAVMTEPANGKVNIQKGGYYSYTSNAGFRGRDTFKMRLCGIFEQQEYCTMLNYAILVR